MSGAPSESTADPDLVAGGDRAVRDVAGLTPAPLPGRQPDCRPSAGPSGPDGRPRSCRPPPRAGGPAEPVGVIDGARQSRRARRRDAGSVHRRTPAGTRCRRAIGPGTCRLRMVFAPRFHGLDRPPQVEGAVVGNRHQVVAALATSSGRVAPRVAAPLIATPRVSRPSGPTLRPNVARHRARCRPFPPAVRTTRSGFPSLVKSPKPLMVS